MATDTQDKVPSQGKAWFFPALAAIVLAGVIVIWFTGRVHGPATSLLDPAAAARNRATFDKAMALLDRVRPLLEAEDYKQALPLAKQALTLAPDQVHTHMAVAQIALQIRDYDLAEKEFQAVLDRKPDDQESQFNLAGIAACRKNYDSARKHFDAGMALVKDRQAAARFLPLQVLQAAIYMDQLETAQNHLSDAVRGAGRSDNVLLLEARVYGPDVVTLLADQLEQQDRPAGAAAALAEAAKQTSGNLGKAQRAARSAELYLAAGNRDTAGEQVRIALEADPANPQWVVLRDKIQAGSQPTSRRPAVKAPIFGLPAN